jgi:hypothetical protein
LGWRLGLNKPKVAIENNSLPTPLAMLPLSRASALPNDSLFLHFAVALLLEMISANKNGSAHACHTHTSRSLLEPLPAPSHPTDRPKG